MKKIIRFLGALVLLTSMLTGCELFENQNATTEVTTEAVVQPTTSNENESTNETTTIETEPESTTVEETTSTQVILTDSGSYNGQADGNFIEISISGVPNENAAKVFMLSEELKSNFDSYGLETGDNIRFDYYINNDGQNVIVRIEKI